MFKTLTLKAKLVITAAVVVVSSGVSFGAAWKYQGSRWKATVATLKGTHADALKALSDKALADYNRMEKTKDEAIETHNQAAAADRAAAADAKRTAAGLRKQLDQVPSLIATATESALREYASTTSELLGSCTAEYQRMAATAQRHATDVILLLNAWPRSQQPVNQQP